MSASLRDVRVIADKEVGLDGGYRLELHGKDIGRVERTYPTWERRTKGRRYVNARGTCKRAEYDALKPGQWARGYRFRTLRDAVRYLFEQATSTEGLS